MKTNPDDATRLKLEAEGDQLTAQLDSLVEVNFAALARFGAEGIIRDESTRNMLMTWAMLAVGKHTLKVAGELGRNRENPL